MLNRPDTTQPDIPNGDSIFSYFEFLGNIQPHRELAQPQTSTRLKELGEGVREVAIGQTIVSAQPLVSYAFGYCKGLIIKNGNRIALSHLLLNQDPDEFIQFSKEKLGEVGTSTAITIVPDNDDKLRESCQRHGIEVTDTIVVNGEVLKDIIANPETGEIVILAQDSEEVRTMNP